MVDRLEVRPLFPPDLCSRERKGEDTGSREEMGAFLTTEEGDPERAGAGEAPGEGVEQAERGGTALAALARMEGGMGFLSASMTSSSSSFCGAQGEEFLAGMSSWSEGLIWLSRLRSLAIWYRKSMGAPLVSEPLMPSWRKCERAWLESPRLVSNWAPQTSHFTWSTETDKQLHVNMYIKTDVKVCAVDIFTLEKDELKV